MRPFIQSIQSAPDYFPRSAAEIPTREERAAEEFELFRTDASMTVVAAMSTLVTSLATKIADMVALSAKTEWRARYGILRDYSAEPNTLTAVASIRKEVHRNEAAFSSVIGHLTRSSSFISGHDGWNGDAGDNLMSRIDTADVEFQSDYDAIRRQIIELFRPFKCSDPLMLYPLLNAIYMAGRFSAMSRWIASFATGFRKGEPLASCMYLHVQEPLRQLAHRMNLTDKHGHPLHFIFTDEERESYKKQAAKRSFQLKHADSPPVVVDVREIFCFDDLTRRAWQLETHMMDLRTIDRLITASEGHDPEYRHDYSMKRLQPCASTYEQAMINQVIHLYKWHEIPMRMRAYLDSIQQRKCIDPRRRPKPVVGFHLNPMVDKKGCPVLNREGKPDFTAEFIGIWNSSFEAQQEWGTRWQDIRRSVTLKAVNDGKNNVWLSLDDYLSMTYNHLRDVYPKVADEFLHLIPELKVRTTNEIASETAAPQGSFAQSAKTVS